MGNSAGIIRTWLKREEMQIAAIALLIAIVLGAHDVTRSGMAGWLASHLYWICRILIECSIFLSFLYAIEKYAPPSTTPLPRYALAILISLIPFTLAITSFDLILGLPELGLNKSDQQSPPGIRAFGLELIYLLDNHLALCTLLLVPRLLGRRHQGPAEHAENAATTEHSGESAASRPETITPALSFLARIDPPLQGRVRWIEAQEHYVRIVTSSESRMVLFRFSDAIRELPANWGMQVHRSHWVAFSAVQGLKKDGQSLRLELAGGDSVPVSRSFRANVEERVSAITPDS